MEVTINDYPNQVENKDEELEEEKVLYTISEYLSPYHHLYGYIVMSFTSRINIPELAISEKVEKHDTQDESQDHPNSEVSTPLNLNIISSPLKEENIEGQHKTSFLESQPSRCEY